MPALLCLPLLERLAAVSLHLHLTISVAVWGLWAEQICQRQSVCNAEKMIIPCSNVVMTAINDLHSPHAVCGICLHSLIRHIDELGPGQARPGQGRAAHSVDAGPPVVSSVDLWTCAEGGSTGRHSMPPALVMSSAAVWSIRVVGAISAASAFATCTGYYHRSTGCSMTSNSYLHEPAALGCSPRHTR